MVSDSVKEGDRSQHRLVDGEIVANILAPDTGIASRTDGAIIDHIPGVENQVQVSQSHLSRDAKSCRIRRCTGTGWLTIAYNGKIVTGPCSAWSSGESNQSPGSHIIPIIKYFIVIGGIRCQAGKRG